MKPHLNCWTCFFFLPCASSFAGGLRAGLGVVLGTNLGTNCSHHVCKLLMVWARDGTLAGQFPLINFVTNPFAILLRYPSVEVTMYLNLVTCGSPLGQHSCLDTKYEQHASQNQGIRQHIWHTAERIEKHTTKINSAKIDGTNGQRCLDIGIAWIRGGGICWLVLSGSRICLCFVKACLRLRLLGMGVGEPEK